MLLLLLPTATLLLLLLLLVLRPVRPCRGPCGRRARRRCLLVL
jgi:hypothetical protein